MTGRHLISSLLLFVSIFVAFWAVLLYLLRQYEIAKLNDVQNTEEPVPQMPGLTVCILIIVFLLLFLIGFAMRTNANDRDQFGDADYKKFYNS